MGKFNDRMFAQARAANCATYNFINAYAYSRGGKVVRVEAAVQVFNPDGTKERITPAEAQGRMTERCAPLKTDSINTENIRPLGHCSHVGSNEDGSLTFTITLTPYGAAMLRESERSYSREKEDKCPA